MSELDVSSAGALLETQMQALSPAGSPAFDERMRTGFGKRLAVDGIPQPRPGVYPLPGSNYSPQMQQTYAGPMAPPFMIGVPFFEPPAVSAPSPPSDVFDPYGPYGEGGSGSEDSGLVFPGGGGGGEVTTITRALVTARTPDGDNKWLYTLTDPTSGGIITEVAENLIEISNDAAKAGPGVKADALPPGFDVMAISEIRGGETVECGTIAYLIAGTWYIDVANAVDGDCSSAGGGGGGGGFPEELGYPNW